MTNVLPGRAGRHDPAFSVAPVASGYDRSLRPWLALAHRTRSARRHSEMSSKAPKRRGGLAPASHPLPQDDCRQPRRQEHRFNRLVLATALGLELEDKLLAVLVVPLRAGLAEAEAPDEGERRHVPGPDRGDEVAPPVLLARPLEDRLDRFGRVAAAAEGLEHRVADLQRARLLRSVHAGRPVEADVADH